MGAARKHTVQQGECLSSIAFENGFFWESLWSHPDNAALKGERESPFVLRPGDVVHIPELRQRGVDAPTGARHTFRRKGVPAKLRIRLVVASRPLADQPFVLAFGGREIRGMTTADGLVEIFTPPDMPRATLRVGEGDEARVYDIAPRTLRPAGDVDGMQARLSNLGYYRGPIHGELDAATAAAIERFQREHDLQVTGQVDDATASAVADLHTGAG